MLLGTVNKKETEPTDYTERKTVKAVILGNEGKTLLFPSILIGGGVEDNETYEEALHREAMEEAGVEVEIIKPLGDVIGYRDASKQRYVVKGFLCKYIGTVSAPTTTDEDELKMKTIWEKPEESINRIEKQIEEIKTVENEYDLHTYQRKLHNRQITILFLKEAIKQMV